MSASETTKPTIDLEHFRRATTTSSNAMDAFRNRSLGKSPEQIHDEAVKNMKETTAHLASAKESTALSIANSTTVNGPKMVAEWCQEITTEVLKASAMPTIIGMKILIRKLESKLEEGKAALRALTEANSK